MVDKARFENFAMVLPEKGPLSVPDKISFVANVEQEIDLSQLIENGWLDYISGVYVDNISNTGNLTLRCNGTNQNFFIPGGYSGYFPLLLPNPPKVFINSDQTGDVTFQWYNVPVFPMLIPGPNAASAGSNVNIASVGGVAVSDPLPVSGPLTDTELRASPVDVDTGLVQGLTDAQLRASAVTVDFDGAAWTDRSIANLSGASEQLMAANANRRFIIIQNISTNVMGVNFSGGAAAIGTAGTITIPAGTVIFLDYLVTTSAINIIGTANDDVTAYEV